jgi:Zn-dependent peptidase ImmA (M78 family)
VASIRRDMDISESEVIGVQNMVECFHKYQAVIIPTLWGPKVKHENALHIHLPDSKTTWIYLNLDSKVFDFKYWMAHEFGHVLTIDLLATRKIDAAEDFADAFAGALLFPKAAAEKAYAAYKRARTEKGRISVLIIYAKEYFISPLSVYIETEKYAEAHNFHFKKVDNNQLHTRIGLFNKGYMTLSETLFDGETPTADHFMRVAQENFGTDFYKALGNYLRDYEAPPKSIASILGVSPMDAHAFHEALASM